MRVAFHSWPAHDHRSKSSKISSVAVTEDAHTLYLGLSDGQVEEYSIHCDQEGVKTSLRARKHIGRKVHTDKCHCCNPFMLCSVFAPEHTESTCCSQCKTYVTCGQHIAWHWYAMVSCCCWTKSHWMDRASPTSRLRSASHTCLGR